MSQPMDFDRFVADWLKADGPSDVRPELVDRALAVARNSGQRRGLVAYLTSPAPWPNYGRRIGVAVLPPGLRVALLLGLVLALIGGSLFVGSRLLRDSRQPSLLHLGSLPSIDAPIAVALRDGRILVAGSASEAVLAYVVNPMTGHTEFVEGDGNSTNVQSAVGLTDGRVLLIGWEDGAPGRPVSSAAWLLDPATNTAYRTAGLTTSRFEAATALLADGRVLIAGGLVAPDDVTTLASVEAFDPASGTFGQMPPLRQPRDGQFLVPLDDGRVLVVGGWNAFDTTGVGSQVLDVDVYDPATGVSKIAGTLPHGSQRPPARPVRLSDGRVLIPGVGPEFCGRHGLDPAPAFIFDPATAKLASAGAFPHKVTALVALPDGRVVVAGSWQGTLAGCREADSANVVGTWIGIFDPATGVTLEGRNPISGASTLAIETDREYRAGLVMTDSRVVLIGDELSISQGGVISRLTKIDVLTVAR